MLAEDIRASIAHARMLGRQRIIPPEDADRIVRALLETLDEYDRGEWQLRADLEDVHTNVEARLREKIGDVAGKLHTARSRNDQVATDLRLYVLRSSTAAMMQVIALQRVLLGIAEANIDAIMPGYTHLQRGQPVLFSHHLLAYVEMLQRDVQRLLYTIASADSLPLGSGALAGVPYPVDREFVAEELDMSRISANSIDAVSDRDFVVDYVYAGAMIMVHISRLAEELILWSSAEFGFITLPDAFATGSSIMPQKKNPDVAELARGRTGRAVGELMAVLTMLKGLPLSYNRDLQEDKSALFDTENAVISTLDIMASMLPHVRIDRDRMLAAAVANHSLATDYADYLVRKGAAFRDAHEAVGKLVRRAEERNVDLSALSLEDLRSASPLFAEDALSIDAQSSVASRDVPGGTAPNRVRDAITADRQRIDDFLASVAEDEDEDEPD